ncbi:DNA polymerase I [Leptothoe spongobia]|uniref:DNA polymerase I n=1 Tax=Leptothoe spongobia TAU-MAC 1115 TaxID=1967444 RepID=A0A947DGW0_9CYAN|nr:DNA polymerase I [Leptothoe spongobia]MBT9315711.1 DNA polymerase I [Leptothoe spongobia TAU-MAC 1115]
MSSDRPTLLIIDGHSLAFRSYYAHAKSRDGGLRTSKGIPTSVCFGFLKSMSDMMVVEKPDYAAVAFDLAQPTFRHEAAESYKEGRPETPEDFIEDVENLKQLLAGFKLPILTAPGFEADDVIGTLATKAEQEGYAVKILSGDQDLFQLIDDNEHIKVLHLGSTFGRTNGLAKEYGIKEVEEKLGIKPNQVIDYKALCGDTSDNIPGVRGIGKKTAVKLLTEHENLERVYDAVPEMKGAVKKKLETGKEDADKSKYLATIVTDIDLDVELADCKLDGFDEGKVVPLLKNLEFQHFINRLNKLQTAFGGEVTARPKQVSTSVEDEETDFFTAEETDAASDVKEVDIQPQIIMTEAQLQALVTQLEAQTDGIVAWDTETTAIDPLDAELVGIGCCWGEGPADLAYIPVGHLAGDQLPLTDVLSALKPILESADYPKSLQNAKYDRAVLKRQGIELTGVVFDTMLASYVLNPENSHNLTDLSLRHLNLAAQSYSDLVPKGKTIADIAIEQVAVYCGGDVHSTYRLVPILQAELKQVDAIATLFRDIEVPLEVVLADMEATGIRIDEPYLKQFSEQLETDLYELQIKAYDYAGEEFNLSSPKQLSVLLFETLGLNKKKTRKTKTGYSTDASTLEKLQGDHPVVDCIVSHRTLSKLKSTYVDALPKLVRADTGRVHTDFNQAVTATGRLSSSNPNLQNIPVRTAFSRQIRQAFLPQEDWLLAAADYSQIELRILTHLSGESVLVDAYRTGQDVHSLTAQLLLDKEEITSDERRMGKIINFGVIYGMGAVRFAREMGVSRTEAKSFIDKFNQRYSRVFEYLQQMQREAIAHGYVETILGRRRYFNFSSNSLRPLKGRSPDEIELGKLKPGGYDAGLLRAAANAPIQGSSADIIKIAMIQLHEVLKDYQARLLLQVHDELIFEIPPDEWPELEKKITQTMESVVKLSVPLKVEINAGKNWMDAK